MIHTNGQEIGYYDSIEKLTDSLPRHFVRCHRSYIINTRMIKELRGAEKELKLVDGQRVPFSRSYSSAVKQVVSGFVSGMGS